MCSRLFHYLSFLYLSFLRRYVSRQYALRMLLCTIGVFIIGFGAGALRYGSFGIDPFMSLTNGLFIQVFGPLGIGFGTSFLILCCAALLAVLFLDRSKTGAGTLINMGLTGYVSDFALSLLSKIPAAGTALVIARIAGMLGGVVVICFGAGIYLNTGIGASPYDAIGLIIPEKLKRPEWYRWIRIGTDFICTGFGLLMGSVPGAGTLIMAFCTGPLIAFFRFKVLVLGKRAGVITWM